jgi:hypothetical protein
MIFDWEGLLLNDLDLAALDFLASIAVLLVKNETDFAYLSSGFESGINRITAATQVSRAWINLV